MSKEKEKEASATSSRWDQLTDFIRENWQTLLVALIVLLIGNSAYNNSKKENGIASTHPTEHAQTQNAATESSAEATHDNPDTNSQNQNNSDEKTPDGETSKTNEPQPTEIKNNAKEYAQAARRGEGRTHLARRAMQEYLQENQDTSLTAAHQVYIEDFLQKQTGRGGLILGQSLSFSATQIQAAIKESKKLSPADLKNLQKYVH